MKARCLAGPARPGGGTRSRPLGLARPTVRRGDTNGCPRTPKAPRTENLPDEARADAGREPARPRRAAEAYQTPIKPEPPRPLNTPPRLPRREEGFHVAGVDAPVHVEVRHPRRARVARGRHDHGRQRERRDPPHVARRAIAHRDRPATLEGLACERRQAPDGPVDTRPHHRRPDVRAHQTLTFRESWCSVSLPWPDGHHEVRE